MKCKDAADMSQALIPRADQAATFLKGLANPHRLLILCARMAGNRRLQRMLTGLSLQTLRYSKLGLASVERRLRSARLWQEATDAMATGDTERMVALTRQRIEESADEAVRVLRQPPAAGGGA